jgi:phosphate/sulfate permease
LGGGVSLIGWFIVAAACLSPILTFWLASVLARFLRRKRQSHVLKADAAVRDRSRSIRKDDVVDPK